MKNLRRILLIGLLLLWAALLLFPQTRVTPYSTNINPIAWTSATAQNTALTVPTFSFNTALVALNQTSTIIAGNVAFEGSETPDTSVTDNWYGVPCMAPTTAGTSYGLTASTKIAFQCNIAGYKRFRLRLSNVINGTGTVNGTLNLTSVGAVPPGNQQPSGSSSATVTNLPATVDTNNGAATANTPRVAVAPNTSASPFNTQPTLGVSSGGLVTVSYLGFGSANTAKTTGAVTITSPTAGHNVLAVGCAGNFNSANWADSVTDSNSDAFVPLAVNFVNSTTQECHAFIFPNITAVTTITYTISGSNSANTTIAVMAWDVGNAIPGLPAVDLVSGSSNNATTAISITNAMTSQPNEALIAAGCASTGTISLPTGSGLTFDSGSQAIASGANIVTCFGGHAILAQPSGVAGNFSDGSSAAWAEVLVSLRGYTATDANTPHVNSGTINNLVSNPAANFYQQTPLIASATPGWSLPNNPGSGTVAATVTATATAGRYHVITGFCYSMVGDSTGAAETAIVTLAGSLGYTAYSDNISNAAGVSSAGSRVCVTNVAIPFKINEGVTLAFSAAVAHALEAVDLFGYSVAANGLTY